MPPLSKANKPPSPPPSPHGGEGPGIGVREELVSIFIAGNRFQVPPGVTILRALEYAGFRITRGCGCRAGFCGACATVYRAGDDHTLRFAMACQTPVVPDMQLVQISYYPSPAPRHDVRSVIDPVAALHSLHPELNNCLGCNTCTKTCPQDLPVMDIVASMVQGDLRRATELSIECIMCGLCASRCPASIMPHHAALFARRAYARLYQVKSGRLAHRIADIQAGRYDEPINALMNADVATLRKLYAERDFQIDN